MANIIIVDEQDRPLGVKERNALTPEDIYRVSALWLRNSKGEVLLAQRHRTKKHHPLKWGPAVAGTVEEGESYLDNIVKETEEELGLKNMELKEGPKEFRNREYLHFTQWYTAIVDKEAKDFVIPEDEVEQVRWYTVEALLERVAAHPEEFLGRMEEMVHLFEG